MQNEKLINFRKSINMSREDFATLLDVSASYVEKIEKGERNPSYNFIKKFKARFPKVNVDDIFFTTKPHVKCNKKSTA
ncbi:helix-turn-helix domain-containing protein [Anaerosolibacter sp.]|uniref:helix-turn-helix domain-containing protein n=1 Tax=Anaerosolibacter sp. TaxID=1872527 RepID=UPI0039F11FBD